MDFDPSGITSPSKPSFISCLGCGICHSNRKVTNAEVSTREYVIAVADLAILMFEGLWKALELWIREMVDCCKQWDTLVGAQKTAVWRAMWMAAIQHKRFQRGVISAAALDAMSMILQQRVWTLFAPCPKNLPKAKFKSNELISLVEKTLRQPNTDSAACLLVIICTWLYNQKAQMGQKEIQNAQFGEGKNSGKPGVTAKTFGGRKTVRMLSRKVPSPADVSSEEMPPPLLANNSHVAPLTHVLMFPWWSDGR